MSKFTDSALHCFIRSFTILVIMLTFLSGYLHADELRSKIAVEVIYNWKNYSFRVRPLDYVNPPGRNRVDLLFGRRFGDFSAYLYWKYNSEDEHFMGARLDYTARALEERLRAIFQFRAFVGLNSRSEEHFYFITQWDYQVDNAGTWRPGVLGYGVRSVNGDALFFLGPALTTKVTKFMSFRLSYGFDLLSSDTLLYFKCYLFI